MTTRGRLKALECEYVTFDGTNAAEVEALAGKDWMGNLQDPPSVLVRNINGHTVGVQPGWTVARWGRHRRRDRQLGGSMGGPGGDGMSFGASAGNSLRESRWPVPSWAFGICP